MAVFNANKNAGDDNCFLFHCQTEQDCPLMKAQDGINTYDIYKGNFTCSLSQSVRDKARLTLWGFILQDTGRFIMQY